MRSRRERSCLPIIDNLEDRVCLSSVGWDGAGRGSATLTYYIGKAPSNLTQAAVESAIETALDAWSDVAKITFVQTTRAGLARSLDFSFTRLDGAGGTLAQAYFPADVNPSRIAGDVQFDSSETWEIGNTLGTAAFDLVLTAAHEIGHALGLDHSNGRSSIMGETISASQTFNGLGSSDKTAILSLYAAAQTTTTTTPTPTTPGNTNPNTNTSTNTNNNDTPAIPTVPTGPRYYFGYRFPRGRWR